jgi:hypothetical protein
MMISGFTIIKLIANRHEFGFGLNEKQSAQAYKPVHCLDDNSIDAAMRMQSFKR